MNMLKITLTGSSDYGKYLKILLAGSPGVGKTRFAATAKNCLYLNAEGGSMSIADKKIPSIEITDTKVLQTVRGLLAQDPEVVAQTLGFEVKTVILDTYDEVARLFIRERIRDEHLSGMEAGDWAWLNERLNDLVSGFRSLPYNVIITCHTKKDDVGPDDSILYKLDLSGALAHQLPGAVDVSCVMVRRYNDEDLSSRRLIYTDNLRGYDWIKDRSGKLPHVFEADFESGFEELYNKIFSDVSLEDTEPLIVEFEVRESVEATIPETVADVIEATQKAEAVVASAKAQATRTKREAAGIIDSPSLTQSSGIDAELDVSGYQDGDSVSLDLGADQEVPHGFQIQNGKLMTIRGLRWVYTASDGSKVVSRNQLPEGVRPVLDGSAVTGLWCQQTGIPVSPEQADLSRIRHRAILSPVAMEELSNAAKKG
jgi:hypothetical protein